MCSFFRCRRDRFGLFAMPDDIQVSHEFSFSRWKQSHNSCLSGGWPGGEPETWIDTHLLHGTAGMRLRRTDKQTGGLCNADAEEQGWHVPDTRAIRGPSISLRTRLFFSPSFEELTIFIYMQLQNDVYMVFQKAISINSQETVPYKEVNIGR